MDYTFWLGAEGEAPDFLPVQDFSDRPLLRHIDGLVASWPIGWLPDKTIGVRWHDDALSGAL